MKLSCPRNVLQSAFSIVSGVVPQRSPKEILRNVKLTLADGKATLIGTDEEVGVRYELPEVITESAGEVLLPTQRITAILREVQDDVIRIEVSEEALWIRTSQSEFRLSVEDPAQFPNVAAFEDQDYYVIGGKTLKQAIQRTIFATDTESTRYALGGLLLELDASHLTLAATDGRRLSVVKSSCTAQGAVQEEGGRPVIPAKAMSLIERSIHDEDQEVHLAVHPHHVLVRSGQSTIYSRLVEGRFPKYQDVIPASYLATIEFVAGPFLSAVRQAMIVTNDESRGVDFTFQDGLLTLTSLGQDVGSSRIQLPISYDGEAIKVTFDPRFVQEFLRVLDGAGPVSLNLIDGNSAAVFKADESYTYVVMPLSRDDR
ncbi:DNA polymerase III subunit beta [Planctomicrobium piriforme]|uniref:Beta sliding clamp n=1 Tax=Planctomicrobium piriforme TaxID=1576369 RepID=A0A1I3FWL1_9PLAN|nr:DNA polymerase III subunit beta [Planctomicrobium piriforme]SFI15628.1 DNA polymerase-3 subunit beta [Planctomicrobium piriforme]